MIGNQYRYLFGLSPIKGYLCACRWSIWIYLLLIRNVTPRQPTPENVQTHTHTHDDEREPTRQQIGLKPFLSILLRVSCVIRVRVRPCTHEKV